MPRPFSNLTSTFFVCNFVYLLEICDFVLCFDCPIQLNVICLFVEFSIFNNNYVTRVVSIANAVLVAIYTIEMLIKIIATGYYFCGPNSYLRDNFNKLDFAVLLLSYVAIIQNPTHSLDMSRPSTTTFTYVGTLPFFMKMLFP